MNAPSSSALARILVVSGLAVSLTALTVGNAFFGPSTWLTLGPLGAGVVALVLGLLAGARHTRVSPHKLRLAAEIALTVVAVVALNAATLHAPAVVDVTRSKRNTLTEASANVAKASTAPIVVKTTLPADDRAFLELSDLIGRYQRDGANLTLERISASTDPEAARAFGDEKVVLERADHTAHRRVKFVAGSPDQEQQLTNAMRALSSSSKPERVYFVAGHGEASVADDEPNGARAFGQALVDEGLEVVPLPLALVGSVPDDAAALVIDDANALPDADRAALQKYVDAGGRALFLLEPAHESFASLLGAYGVQANGDVVVDGTALGGVLGPETATGVAYAAHPITQKLGAALTHFTRARSLSENPGTPATTTALVQTGADAFGALHLEPGTQPTFHDGDIKGPLTLMMSATAPSSSSPSSSKRETRIVVAGDATFASNQGIHLGANRDLAVNAVLWLVERDDAIAIRPRGRGGDLLLLTPTARERIAFVLLYGLPVILLCAGLSIGAVRRRR